MDESSVSSPHIRMPVSVLKSPSSGTHAVVAVKNVHNPEAVGNFMVIHRARLDECLNSFQAAEVIADGVHRNIGDRIKRVRDLCDENSWPLQPKLLREYL